MALQTQLGSRGSAPASTTALLFTLVACLFLFAMWP